MLIKGRFWACLAGGVALSAVCFFAGAVSSARTLEPVADPALETSGAIFEINAQDKARIIWNGRDITDEMKGNADVFAEPKHLESSSTKDSANDPPQNYFYWSRAFRPEDEGETPKDLVLNLNENFSLLWQSEHGMSTFARNGKQIVSLSFSGLKDEELVRVSPDGLVLCPSEPGMMELTCTIEDSGGVSSSLTITFMVAEAQETDKPTLDTPLVKREDSLMKRYS